MQRLFECLGSSETLKRFPKIQNLAILTPRNCRSMLALRKEGNEVWSTDVAVPFSRLADIIEVSKKEMDDLGLFASILGHIGDGNFHESILYDRRIDGEKEKVERCVKNMVNRALEMEGTCTVRLRLLNCYCLLV